MRSGFCGSTVFLSRPCGSQGEYSLGTRGGCVTWSLSATPLIEELKAWTEARDALVRGLGKPDEMSALDAQADDLVARLNADLQLRFTAEHLQ